MENFFYHLTPETVVRAIEDSGFRLTGYCMALNSYENRVYDLRLTDTSHIVAKFYRPGRWTREQILEEHEFLFDLRENEIPVCAPVVFPDDTTVHETEGIYFSVWPRTGGRQADELDDANLQILGRYLARIHNVGASREARNRIELTSRTYGLDPLAFLEKNDFISKHCRQRYADAVHEIVSIYDALAGDVPVHRIHGDCHLGNLLNGRDGWFFLDFDDFLTGPAVQDVWMLLSSRDAEGLRQREVFLQAYRVFRDFDDSWLRLIEPLRSLRYIRYSAWIAQRWDDPAFPAAFPHFGSTQYWEDATEDLEEQIEYSRGKTPDAPIEVPEDIPPEPEQPKKPEGESKTLSNKDYFWDWDDRKKKGDG